MTKFEVGDNIIQVSGFIKAEVIKYDKDRYLLYFGDGSEGYQFARYIDVHLRKLTKLELALK